MKLIRNSRKITEVNKWGVTLHDTQVPQPIAAFAMELIVRWGMVAALPDGEDSAGRAKLRLQTPEEVVSRAIRTAEVAFDQFAHKDLLLDVPEPPAL